LCAFAPPIRHHHSQPPFKVQYRTRDHAILMGGPVCKEYSSDLRVDVLAYTNHLRFKVTCRREYIYIILYASICCLSLYIFLLPTFPSHQYISFSRSSPSPPFHSFDPSSVTMHNSSIAAECSSLPITPVFTCAHCSRSQRLGARWGAGTADASGRVFCTYECAWMALLIQEHASAACSDRARPHPGRHGRNGHAVRRVGMNLSLSISLFYLLATSNFFLASLCNTTSP